MLKVQGIMLADCAGEGGSSAAGSAGEPAAAAAAEEGGMRIFSNQIQEWVVEFSCDLLLISIRTDVAWYRLDRCTFPQALSLRSPVGSSFQIPDKVHGKS